MAKASARGGNRVGAVRGCSMVRNPSGNPYWIKRSEVTQEQPMALERLLAAMIKEAGGEIRVSYDALVAAHTDKDQFLTMDIIDNGATLLLQIADSEDVPDDIKQ